MAEIHLLDKQTAEMIAAGEVIERPCSVIKELVENAIDADARKISVELRRGGVAYMRVTDDGGGISAADIRKAFLRHATSKLFRAEDLSGILTMGFRGEALASIAAVCRVEAISRERGAAEGVRYVSEGGIETACEPYGCPDGTTIIAADLFYNTPARMKFLKSDKSEGGAAVSYLERLAVAHPGIAFQAISDGKTVLQTPGSGKLEDAVYTVWGREFFNGLAPVSFEEGSVQVGGYVSRPEASRGKRDMQHFFLNGRMVRSTTLTAALEAACRDSLMKGRFPSCVLDLRLPPEVYDVNAHPAKLEVRFADEKRVFDYLFRAVRAALLRLSARGVSPGFQRPKPQDPLRIDAKTFREILGAAESEKVSVPAPAAKPAVVQTQRNPPAFPAKTLSRRPAAAIDVRVEAEEEPAPLPVKPPDPEPLPAEPPGKRYEGGRLVGELFRTYLCLEFPEELVLIDKHAAHERLIYERIRSGECLERQLLLEPLPVALPAESRAALLQNAGLLELLGFEAEDFGEGCLLVRGIPTMLDLEDAGPSFSEIAEALLCGGTARVSALDDLYHSIACKAAVKAGDLNGAPELETLLRLLNENEAVRFCPHGRPIAVTVSRKQMESLFGRT